MTAHPVTIQPLKSIYDALETMKAGHFRHVPVVDDEGKLVAMLSDHDVRLIHPSQAFVAEEQAALELTSATVSQAAVYDPVTVRPDTSLERATQLMLQWEIGGLPVVSNDGVLVGMITYTDLLYAFVPSASPKMVSQAEKDRGHAQA